MPSAAQKPTIYVVSNRLPVTVKRTDEGSFKVEASSGGLVGALQGLSESLDFQWYGWPGPGITEDEQSIVREQLAEHKAHPIFLADELAEKHYNGFSNKIMWPLLHYQTSQIVMSRPDWEAYQEVNRTFARAIASQVRSGDIVWIQDYHLLLMPQYLREAVGSEKSIRIGLFLHTVFPASDYIRILPVRQVILEALLHCDLIGFHEPTYADHFRDSCRRILHLKTTDAGVQFRDRTVKTLAIPIGIDQAEFFKVLDEPRTAERTKELCEKYKGVKLLISVDRLDYIKGIIQRMEAFDLFLDQHPEFVGKVTLLQIVIPSREQVPQYRSLHDEINLAVSHVNGKHGSVDITPVQSLFSSVPKPELTALYSVADACIVSSLRDGFNVVSLEYVTCQAERHGVLVLSEFAGAVDILRDALIFNPWDTEGFAETLHRALTMDEGERKARWEKLNERAAEFSSKRWGETFINAVTSE